MSTGEEILSNTTITSAADLTEVGLRTRATPLLHAFRDRLPLPDEMTDIQDHFGVEIATTVFTMALETVAPYAQFLRKIRSQSLLNPAAAKGKAKNFEVLVVASNSAQSGRKWGDHVDTWTAWARSMGFTTDWVPTDSVATVNENARILSRYLINNPHPNRILVTYGQGASELRVLMLNRLGERGRPFERKGDDEFAGVKLWLNVCGAYGGNASNEPMLANPIARARTALTMLARRRQSMVLHETRESSPLMTRIPNFPVDMGVINVIGLPLRSHMPMGFNRAYLALSKRGPNDGVLSLYQMIAHPGLIVPIPAMAHTASDFKLEPVFKRVLSMFLESASVQATSHAPDMVDPIANDKPRRLNVVDQVLSLDERV